MFDIPRRFTGHCFIEGIRVELFFKDGKTHREDGPARIYTDTNSMEWWVDGIRHRLDGPAVFFTSPYNGNNLYYYIDGEPYKEQDYWIHPLVLKHKLDEIIKPVD